MYLEEQIVRKLFERSYTVTTAESCTGGLLAGRIVNVAGVSEVFGEGYITYSNEAKERILGVPRDILVKYGAVSEQTAREMALGAAEKAGAEVGLSTTGVAGPGGGTLEKPVGLVYVGCAVNGHVSVRELRLSGTRDEIRQSTVTETLNFLNEIL